MGATVAVPHAPPPPSAGKLPVTAGPILYTAGALGLPVDFSRLDPAAVAELLSGPVELAAAAMLGGHLTANGVTVRLTEVEAYGGLGADPASHAHRRTKRSEIMFGPSGRLYVYFTYGMHWCANVVCGPAGEASAVLLRAGEVVEGLAVARKRRGSADRDLARGPARLAQALGWTGADNGLDLLDPPALALSAQRPSVVRTGPRIGLTKEVERPWRFWLPGEPTVSGPARAAQ
jgi:DNA-3-methyladenine glycosylase